MLLYALTIFTSAFLLFLVQPVMAKQILPWFGGSAAVWTTCLVFFQFLLLFGYAYSDWTTRKLRPRTRIALHVALLLLSLASLPILPDTSWKPDGGEDPTWRILGLLGGTIGLPYFLLSTTGPLVQAWCARTFPAGSTVYRLFALSNLASLAALLAYPFAVEPWITTRRQLYGWSWGYALFVALCIAAAFRSARAAAPAAAGDTDGSPPPRTADYAQWLLLSAMGSFMLLAVTNHITHDVASVPFLWILPLTLYLVTFILCFEGRNWYRRHLFFGPLLVIVGTMAWALHVQGGVMDIKHAIPLYAAGLFICCMFFHGELAGMKPAPRHLTTFYLMVALGGAVGGVLVGFVAPRIFDTYYEFGIGLVVTLLLAAYITRRMLVFVPVLALVATGFTIYHVHDYIGMLSEDTLVMARNFYGTLRVKDVDTGSEETAVRRLMHGVIMHGEEFLAPDRQMRPITYYGPTSGVGRVIRASGTAPLRVGLIGLGAGTLAAYGRPGDVYRFYELNPQVVEIARRDFSFLRKSAARIEMVVGDARLSLEHEPQQHFDVLVVDAFSSDSIPVHLVTKEAMAVYLRHLKPDGVIAFHVTNRFLRLAPVVKQIADQYQLRTALIIDDGDDEDEIAKTDWVLVARNGKLLDRPELADYEREIAHIPGLELWTDDFNNLFQILK